MSWRRGDPVAGSSEDTGCCSAGSGQESYKRTHSIAASRAIPGSGCDMPASLHGRHCHKPSLTWRI
eukprot:8200305-Lingulodinium_polyedra.AAC.1